MIVNICAAAHFNHTKLMPCVVSEMIYHQDLPRHIKKVYHHWLKVMKISDFYFWSPHFFKANYRGWGDLALIFKHSWCLDHKPLSCYTHYYSHNCNENEENSLRRVINVLGSLNYWSKNLFLNENFITEHDDIIEAKCFRGAEVIDFFCRVGFMWVLEALWFDIFKNF